MPILPLPEALPSSRPSPSSPSSPSRRPWTATSGAENLRPGQAAARRFPVIRAWLAFAAIGSGIVHLALAHASVPGVAVVLAAFGIAELAWGLVTLILDRLVFPRTIRLAVVAPVAAWGMLAVSAGVFDNPEIASSLRFLPMAVTTLFDLAIAVGLSLVLRWGAGHPDVPRNETSAHERTTRRGGRYSIGLVVGGLIVSLLTTPALTATQNGTVQAPPAPGSGIISHEHGGH